MSTRDGRRGPSAKGTPAKGTSADGTQADRTQADRTQASGMRAAVERWSAAPVVYLHRMPRGLLLAVVFVLLVIGMVGTGWVAAAGLLVLAAALGWFAYLNWPALKVPGRVLRVVALLALTGFALARGIGRF
ncbi:hypothetical protein AGRA3207_006533 [Actinomadura graeca]|uniref:Uncharacterized protein n=1 Tax=Actinomadura graeca TaxID=2750812 RepID=A0ABX8R1W3_9ACTN|nr:DUF6703 family protein [Actinomadura graeca]QXJ25090.1 hypothetical protein AGRA3207_006533 [Actinomadura graeca]